MYSRKKLALESLPIVTGIAVVAAVALSGAYAVAQDYPPYGPNVPLAQFDHVMRPQLTPPPPNLLNDGTGRTAQSEWNTQLLGYDTLDGRSTYQPLVVHQGNRYIAYMAHHAGTAINRLTGKNETNGTSILDVTDPTNPIYLYHIPGPPGSIDAAGNQMVHVCSGDTLPSKSQTEAESKHGKFYMLRTNGNSSGAASPGLESHQIWDVTIPPMTNPPTPFVPKLVTTLDPGATNTHKDWWECYSGVAYLVANDGTPPVPPESAPGWHQSGSNQHIKIYNLHDPANPEYIRDFGFVGQEPTASVGPPPPPPLEGLITPPTGIHGPISAGNRIYAAYGVGGNGVVQILNRTKVLNGCTGSSTCAKSPTQAEMLAPQLGWFTLPGTSLQGGHTSFPIFGQQDGKARNLLLVTSEEGGNECTAGSAPHAAWLYDITDEANPKLIAEDPNDPARTMMDVPNGFDYTWVGIIAGHGVADPVPPHNHCGSTTDCTLSGVYGPNVTPTDPPPQPNAPPQPNNFCNQGARFGVHSSSELFYPPYYGRLVILAWFTGGLRVFDIRNPENPRPIAYFIPAPNENTFPSTGRNNHTVSAIHTNNVEVDDRGLIYIADRDGTGMHIIKLTGQAAAAATTQNQQGQNQQGQNQQ